MTKIELLNNLKSKFKKIGEPVLDIRTPKFLGYKLWRIPVMDGIDDALWENDILVWEDTDGNWFWKNGEPKAQSDFSFQLNQYIKEKIKDGTIEGAFVEVLDNEKENAIVKIVLDQAGLKEERCLTDKDTSGNLQYRAIT